MIGRELLNSYVNGTVANMTFWHGTFRPFPHTDAWYFYDAASVTCSQTDGPVNFSHSSQCAVATWPNLTASLKPEIRAEDCNTTLPYICHNNESLVLFEIFVDYIPSAKLIGLSQMTDFTAKTLDNCLEQCSEISKCVSVEFNETGAICSHNLITKTEESVSYNITRISVSSGMIHVIKSDCSVTVDTAPPPPTSTSCPIRETFRPAACHPYRITAAIATVTLFPQKDQYHTIHPKIWQRF
ncbi:hypothetical protein DPMN_101066 [Dreissena polymorpha]|uniref:Apple domain-containing protein n=1 Tax=Dreissena polymorpha TaxID=45954 RepID=A0A9D4LH09_DREPO|nr:hypothetical protein DPMN_101066 [Dreissena polymorpha]